MSAHPPDGSDQPETVDQVMLAVLLNPGRDAIVLTPDEERLLDDWVAGRLGPDAAERAAGLAKRNALAAERILERRLLDAAKQSPPVPQSLTTRVLGSAAASRGSAFSSWWRSLGRRRWIPIAGAAALASIAAIAIVPALLRTNDNGAPLQVAMVSFADRTPLFESSDIRMRGAGTQQGATANQRFHDVEVPTRLLRNLVATVGQPASTASRQIEAYLPKAVDDGTGPVRIIIDSALKERIEANDGRDRVPVRIYDLKDPRAADIRSAITDVSGTARTYLLTVKP